MTSLPISARFRLAPFLAILLLLCPAAGKSEEQEDLSVVGSEMMSTMLPGEHRIYCGIVPIGEINGVKANCADINIFEAKALQGIALLDMLQLPFAEIEKAVNCFGESRRVQLERLGDKAPHTEWRPMASSYFRATYDTGSIMYSSDSIWLDLDVYRYIKSSLGIDLERVELVDPRITIPLVRAAFIANEVQRELWMKACSSTGGTQSVIPAASSDLANNLPTYYAVEGETVSLGIEQVQMGYVHVKITDSNNLKVTVIFGVDHAY